MDLLEMRVVVCALSVAPLAACASSPPPLTPVAKAAVGELIKAAVRAEPMRAVYGRDDVGKAAADLEREYPDRAAVQALVALLTSTPYYDERPGGWRRFHDPPTAASRPDVASPQSGSTSAILLRSVLDDESAVLVGWDQYVAVRDVAADALARAGTAPAPAPQK